MLLLMDIGKKIQFIEDQVKELTAYRNELRNRLESTLDASNIVFKSSKDNVTNELLISLRKLGEKSDSEIIEILRNESNIIRKISISTSDIINDEINLIEKLSIKKNELADKVLNEKTIEILNEYVECSKQYKQAGLELARLIVVVRNCIKDTLDKLKN